MKPIIFSIILASLLFSCQKKTLENQIINSRTPTTLLPTEVYVMWVKSELKDCVGVAPMKCFQVQKSEKLLENNWTLFYAKIQNFDFEPGYQYKLMIKEEKLPQELVPQDASSAKYTLVKVLEKIPQL